MNALIQIFVFAATLGSKCHAKNPFDPNGNDGILKVHKNGKEICFNAEMFPDGVPAIYGEQVVPPKPVSSSNTSKNLFNEENGEEQSNKAPAASFVSGNEIVTAYQQNGCKGRSLSFPLSHVEGRCNYCWDSCSASFDDGTPAHTEVMSIYIPEGVVAIAFASCLGSFGYSDPGYKGVLEPGCNDIGKEYIVHVTFAEESVSNPGTYEVLGKENFSNGNFESEMSTEHWMYGPGGIDNAEGTSWYQYIFELLDPTEPRMMFQVGNGGTWLTPTQSKKWQLGDPCHCDPNDQGEELCEEEDLIQCTNGCCGTNGCAGGVQTMEGGSGYWLGKLPTPKVKWTIGSVSKCYRYWSNSPLEVANSDDLECDSMGVIAVSNRLLYPPDGIGFVNDGMFGHAWINTPIGKVRRTDWRRRLTLILDTKNFKGPVAYMLPEYYGNQSKWQNNDGKYYPTDTFVNKGMTTGGGAFEWSTVPVYGHQSDSSRDIRIPKMQFSFNEGKKTVLMSAGKSWTSKSDLYTPLNKAMDGKKPLKEFNFLRLDQGYVHPCEGMNTDLRLDFEGKTLHIGAQVKHREESDGMCSAVVEWDESSTALNCNATHCKLQDTYKVGTESIVKQNNGKWIYNSGSLEAHNSMPNELDGNNVFPEHGFWLNYDRRSPQKLCGAKPAVWELHCRQTSTEDWIAWKWYAFKNQPGFQRLNLSNKQRNFLQRRIIRLHKAMEKNAPLNQWLKTPNSMNDLVTIDPKLLITPPEEKYKYGYVPIVVYQGMEKPDPCIEV